MNVGHVGQSLAILILGYSYRLGQSCVSSPVSAVLDYVIHDTVRVVYNQSDKEEGEKSRVSGV